MTSDGVIMTSDPSHAYERGLKVESGKNDTTQLTIAILTGISGTLFKSLGISEP